MNEKQACGYVGEDGKRQAEAIVSSGAHAAVRVIGKGKKETLAEIGKWFWGRVEVRATDVCWPWKGAIGPCGYGSLRVNGGKGRAHRVAYELAYHRAPGALGVLHRCDNPLCCNPSHLFLGTQRDNLQDMWKKGRGRWNPNPTWLFKHGEDHATAKISDADVAAIRARWDAGETAKEIAKSYPISTHYLWLVARGYKRGAPCR